MARTSTITYGQVAQIADAMKAAGHRPTARSVRERIGSGSMGTIHKLLSQWAGTAPVEDVEAPELPESIAMALMEFVSTEVATACEPLARELLSYREEAKALAEENERLEKIIADLEEARVRAENRAAMAEGGIAEMRLALDQVKTEEAGKYLKEIEALKAKNGELESALACQKDLYTAADKERAVLSTRLEGMEARLQDGLRQIEEGKKAVKGLSQELLTATTNVQACQARLETAARELTSAEMGKAKAEADKDKAVKEAAEVRGELNALKKAKPGVTTGVKPKGREV